MRETDSAFKIVFGEGLKLPQKLWGRSCDNFSAADQIYHTWFGGRWETSV